MPKLTNNHDLPEAFVRYEEKNPYSKDGADFSVTEMIDSPQIAHLKRVHDDEIEEDVSGRIMSILGTAIHEILQHGADEDDIAERRFWAEMLGKTVSGQCDLLSPLGGGEWALKDYKTVRGSALIINPNGQESWEKQLNCYAYLAKENGYFVSEAEVIAVVRDWTAALVRRDAKFPRQSVVRIPIKLWSFDQQKEFMERCIRDHTADPVRECTNEERWKGRKIFAVTKYLQNGGLSARAHRLFNSSSDAEMFIIDNNLKAEVLTRDSVPTRCVGNYCGVSSFCSQYMSELD